MIIIDTDRLYDGEKYRAIMGKAEGEDEWIKFLQPLSARKEGQQSHDSILNYLLEAEEDIEVRRGSLGPETETPEY